jgi:hypothetical protein
MDYEATSLFSQIQNKFLRTLLLIEVANNHTELSSNRISQKEFVKK